jgi:hypothetical protein
MQAVDNGDGCKNTQDLKRFGPPERNIIHPL